MKHLAIIPAYNEEENLDRLLVSLLHQTRALTKIIVVDDGSKDNTAKIVNRFMSKNETVHLVQNPNKDPRATGAKIVKAFNLGLESADLEAFDLISKFDADLQFPQDYNEQIIQQFSADPKLGLTGGQCVITNGSNWEVESVSKNDHIRGALKTYRVDAFRQMDGLKTFMGWDSADEFLLRYYGWTVKLVEDLHVKHFRETNQMTDWKKVAKLNAQVFHNLSYGFWIGSFSALKRGLKNKPLIISGILCWLSFVAQFFGKRNNHFDKDQVKFIRNYRWKGIF